MPELNISAYFGTNSREYDNQVMTKIEQPRFSSVIINTADHCSRIFESLAEPQQVDISDSLTCLACSEVKYYQSQSRS